MDDLRSRHLSIDVKLAFVVHSRKFPLDDQIRLVSTTLEGDLGEGSGVCTLFGVAVDLGCSAEGL